MKKRITNKDIANRMSGKINTTKGLARLFAKAFIEEIVLAIENGEEVYLWGLGRFRVSTHPVKNVRIFGKQVQKNHTRKVVRFATNKPLKQRLNLTNE